VRAGYLELDRALMLSLAKFAACGIVLAGALWFAAAFANQHLTQLGAMRDEAALLLLIVTGAVVYAGSILLLFGRGWLMSLLRST
jgi:putative peptidoglycan lipid II flippase